MSRLPRSPLAVLALVAVAPLGRWARAEEAAEDESRIRPRAVAIAIEADTATIRVTARVRVAGPAIEERILPLPVRAELVGATASTGGRRHALARAAAADVDTRMIAIEDTEPAHGRATAIAIRSDEISTTVELAAPRAQTFRLELDLAAPTCFVRDRRYVAIPTDWVPALDAATRARVVAEEPSSDATSIAARCGDGNGWSDGAEDAWVGFPTAELAARPPGDPRIGTRAARFAASGEQLVRVELALSAEMSAVPADLATAIVVDASRSTAGDGWDAQRTIVDAYLARAPDAQVQVIAFDRVAHSLLARWTRAREARRSVAGALARRDLANGSDLDAGLAEAGRWLADVGGTRRVVVFTDELLPARVAALDPARLATLLPPGTLVHVVAVDGVTGIFRDDDALLAPLALATGGLAARAGIDRDDAGDPLPIDATRLVRPISLDHVHVITPGLTAVEGAALTGFACAEPTDGVSLDLAEGLACSLWARGAAARDDVTVEGLVWNQPWRRVVPLGSRDAASVARVAWRLVDRETAPSFVAAADRAGGAIGPGWSFVAVWGGDGGYADTPRGGAGFGGICGCDSGAYDIGHAESTARIHVDAPSVEAQLTRAVAACRAPADADDPHATIDLELTKDEIVGVTVTLAGVRGAATTALAACVESAVWGVQLVLPDAPEHQRLSRLLPIGR